MQVLVHELMYVRAYVGTIPPCPWLGAPAVALGLGWGWCAGGLEPGRTFAASSGRDRRLEGLYRLIVLALRRLVAMNLRELDACCMQLTCRSWPVQSGEAHGVTPLETSEELSSCTASGNLGVSLLRRSPAPGQPAWMNFLIRIFILIPLARWG